MISAILNDANALIAFLVSLFSLVIILIRRPTLLVAVVTLFAVPAYYAVQVLILINHDANLHCDCGLLHVLIEAEKHQEFWEFWESRRYSVAQIIWRGFLIGYPFAIGITAVFASLRVLSLRRRNQLNR